MIDSWEARAHRRLPTSSVPTCSVTCQGHLSPYPAWFHTFYFSLIVSLLFFPLLPLFHIRAGLESGFLRTGWTQFLARLWQLGWVQSNPFQPHPDATLPPPPPCLACPPVQVLPAPGIWTASGHEVSPMVRGERATERPGREERKTESWEGGQPANSTR